MVPHRERRSSSTLLRLVAARLADEFKAATGETPQGVKSRYRAMKRQFDQLPPEMREAARADLEAFLEQGVPMHLLVAAQEAQAKKSSQSDAPVDDRGD
jgi:hypothetical protein